MAGVRLERLRIDRYRNVAPGTELRFSEGFNVLLGKNGTGKTTLLDLIAMIASGCFAPLKDRSFAFEYRLSLPGASVDVTIANLRDDDRAGEPGFPGFTAPEVDASEWSYRVAVRFDGLADPYVFEARPDSSVLHAGRHGAHKLKVASPYEGSILLSTVGRLPFLRPENGFLDEVKAHAGVILRVMQFGSRTLENCARFDETLQAFATLTGEETRAQFPRYHQDTADPREREHFSFVPDQMRQVLKDRVATFESGGGLTLAHTDLDFLRRAVELFGFRGASMSLRLLRRDPTAWGERLLFGDLSFGFTLQDGTTIEQQFLSYGQKRLLSFFYYATANPDVVIADELPNGMHHDWVEACVAEICGRQSFLASQDPLLFDFLAFDSAEEVEKSFILCGLEQRDGRGHFVWKNLDPDSAGSFHRAYEAGIQHVSEILRTKGLW